MGRVLVFGSINTDFVTYVGSLPAPGETVTGGKFMSFPGGKGANQAVDLLHCLKPVSSSPGYS